MKHFIKKIIILFIAISCIYLSLGYLADGYSDPFYLRFTTPKQKSLIIGTSRAAQGIAPSILNDKLDKSKFNLPIYNYSFTIHDSPYGETYYKLIVKKIDQKNNNGIFILDINPWGLSSVRGLKFPRESKKHLSRLTYVSMNPNYDYLRSTYGSTMFDLIYKKINKDTTLLLREDGRLIVRIDMDSTEVLKRISSKAEVYKKTKAKFSPYRLKWLKKTVNFLKNKGTVILVRIPVSEEFVELENKFMPNLDSIIKKEFPDLKYLNYTGISNQFLYPDGNHLYHESCEKFTEILVKDINKYYN